MADITRRQFVLRLPEDLLAQIDAVRTTSRNLWFEQTARAALDPQIRVVEDTETGYVPDEEPHPMVPEKRHLHHFNKEGDPIAYNKGQPVYRRVCPCGATKEE